MCALSVIYDYGARMPGEFWNERESLEAFQRLIEEAKRFDQITKQPDCEDPKKAEVLKDVLERLAALEKKDRENPA